MMCFFVLLTEVYIKVFESKSLFLNTLTKEIVILDKTQLVFAIALEKQRYIEVNSLPKYLHDKLRSFGYYLNAVKAPFVLQPYCHVVSSLDKFRNATGILDGKDILGYVNQIRFHFPSTCDIDILVNLFYFDKDEVYNSEDEHIDVYKKFLSTFPLSYHISIELLGVFNKAMYDFMNYLINRGITFFAKCLVNSQEDIEKIIHLDNNSFCAMIFAKHSNIITHKYNGNIIIFHLSEISLSSSAEKTKSSSEIIKSSGSISDIAKNQIINSELYGSIDVCADNLIRCMKQHIGRILEFDTAFYNWINSSNCIWYHIRAKKNKCCNCLLQDVCPPITCSELTNEDTIFCGSKHYPLL